MDIPLCSVRLSILLTLRKEKKNSTNSKTLDIYSLLWLFAPDFFCSDQPRRRPQRDTEKEKWLDKGKKCICFKWYETHASYEILLPPNAGMRYFNITVIHCSTIHTAMSINDLNSQCFINNMQSSFALWH